ncbi:MAG: hypothetical protein R3F11_23015 [Verrucomicrobiales bacterium]
MPRTRRTSSVASYHYDALFRRTVKSLPSASDRHLYYNDSGDRSRSASGPRRMQNASTVGRRLPLGLHPPQARDTDALGDLDESLSCRDLVDPAALVTHPARSSGAAALVRLRHPPRRNVSPTGADRSGSNSVSNSGSRRVPRWKPGSTTTADAALLVARQVAL